MWLAWGLVSYMALSFYVISYLNFFAVDTDIHPALHYFFVFIYSPLCSLLGELMLLVVTPIDEYLASLVGICDDTRANPPAGPEDNDDAAHLAFETLMGLYRNWHKYGTIKLASLTRMFIAVLQEIYYRFMFLTVRSLGGFLLLQCGMIVIEVLGLKKELSESFIAGGYRWLCEAAFCCSRKAWLREWQGLVTKRLESGFEETLRAKRLEMGESFFWRAMAQRISIVLYVSSYAVISAHEDVFCAFPFVSSTESNRDQIQTFAIYAFLLEWASHAGIYVYLTKKYVACGLDVLARCCCCRLLLF
jgi:hypothetical protein